MQRRRRNWEKKLKDTQELVFDLTDLEYISSAGLRVLLKVQKYMNKKGDFKLTHVSEVIEEIFEITGFNDILTIE
ncbi:STAS domain-containing protein [Blautia sp. HCP3S3_B11]|uniref:STAS domain-containing protein n=1 Tax=Blautia sp. HCP3S3_B11 TaxID=3438909 RepID=UPI003F8AB35F